MSCPICMAKAAAFAHAAEIAFGVGVAKDYGFTPSPNSRFMARLFDHKAEMHRLAAESHEMDAHPSLTGTWRHS